ncbi:hypothetical protein Pan265_18700 [Mucisphaera calidilacus]|uniref:Uncharacterized protein n=2 Tax=Mucisphaera calidilacus TaxID=2527982 RepID=A0A518BYG1_9BACT|nr:hypothetical protein Pan265_18700 [Mucisphaera calidilacus]
MTTPDPQLIARIAEQVLRAMQASGGSTPAPIQPPLGQCPGAGVLPDPAPVSPPVTVSQQGDPPMVQALTEPPVIDGLITANMIDDAVASSPDGSVILAATARLTPLAQDKVRQAPHRFSRRQVAATQGTLQAINYGQPWLWWTCGQCPAVKQIVEERRHRLLPMIAPREAAALPSVLTDMAGAISTGRAAGGILFVAQAAKPMCFANRLRGIRAILGHCDGSVRQGLRDLGANVLILEFPYNDYDQMAGRVDSMLASSPAVPATIAHALHAVEGARS